MIKIAALALLLAACSHPGRQAAGTEGKADPTTVAEAADVHAAHDARAASTSAADRVGAANAAASAAPARKAGAIDTAHYRPIVPPTMMTDIRARAEYILTHYWDGYRVPADTAFIGSEDTEQLLANFLDLARRHPPETARVAIRHMLEHAQADSATYAYFRLLVDKYLYQPNSPARDEDFYIAALRQIVSSPALSPAQKLTPADRLKQALKNRPGQRAADFAYTDSRGNRGRLSTFKAELTLLFFFDPDCPNCAEAERALGANEIINDLIGAGRLRVLAIYSGTDLKAWTSRLPLMPLNWTVAHDSNEAINRQRLYDLPASPGYYLLDHEKRVLLKEPRPMELVRWLGAAKPPGRVGQAKKGAHAGAGV